MNLSFTYANYFYYKFYYGCLAASTDGLVDKDKGCSPSNRTTFGLVGGRTTLATDPVSTPSAG